MNKYLAVLMVGLLASCGVFKKDQPDYSLEGFPSEEEARAIYVNEQGIDWFDAKYQTKIEGPMNISLKMSLRMKRDSAIWISLSPGMGFEVARILIRPDSVWVVDKINKKYMVDSQEQLAERFQLPVDFQTLQSLFLAEPEQKHLSDLDHYFPFGDEALLSTVDLEGFASWYAGTEDKDLVAYGFKKELSKLSSRYWKQEEMEVKVQYRSYLFEQKADKMMEIPSLVLASFEGKQNASVKFELLSHKLDGPVPMTLKIPRSYEPM